MDWGYVLDFIYETAFFLGFFALFMVFAIYKGRQAIINVIVGLYLALLISLEFPGYEKLFGSIEPDGTSILGRLLLFAVITALTTSLCYRIMPDEFRENHFESIFKKTLLAIGATVLVTIFSFNVLSIGEFLTPGTPIQFLFAPEAYFFWWMLFPMAILFIV